MNSRCVSLSKHLHFPLPVIKIIHSASSSAQKFAHFFYLPYFEKNQRVCPEQLHSTHSSFLKLALIWVLFSRQKRWCHHLLLQSVYKLHSCWCRHFEGKAYSLALILLSLRPGYTKYQPNQINIPWHLLLLQQCENQAPLCSDVNELFSLSSLAQAVSRG